MWVDGVAMGGGAVDQEGAASGLDVLEAQQKRFRITLH